MYNKLLICCDPLINTVFINKFSKLNFLIVIFCLFKNLSEIILKLSPVWTLLHSHFCVATYFILDGVFRPNLICKLCQFLNNKLYPNWTVLNFKYFTFSLQGYSQRMRHRRRLFFNCFFKFVVPSCSPLPCRCKRCFIFCKIIKYSKKDFTEPKTIFNLH